MRVYYKKRRQVAADEIAGWDFKSFLRRFNKLTAENEMVYFTGEFLPPVIHEQTYGLYLQGQATFFQKRTPAVGVFEYIVRKPKKKVKEMV